MVTSHALQLQQLLQQLLLPLQLQQQQEMQLQTLRLYCQGSVHCQAL
jgi:hypothetical protein